MADHHTGEITQLLEDFLDSEIDTSIQLQAIEAKQRRTEEERAAAIILLDSDPVEQNEGMEENDDAPEGTTAP